MRVTRSSIVATVVVSAIGQDHPNGVLDVSLDRYFNGGMTIAERRDVYGKALPPEREHCPRCGGAIRTKHNGMFSWKVCRKTTACGWDVFNNDPERDTL